MSGMHRELVHTFLQNKRYDLIAEFSKIMYPDKPNLVISEYAGEDVRIVQSQGDLIIMSPGKFTCAQESALTEAISNGTIFDDADEIDRHSDYIEKTVIPTQAMTKGGLDKPDKLRVVLSSIIGRMNEDGEIELSDSDMQNGVNFIHTALDGDCGSVSKACDHYLGTYDHSSLPKNLLRDIHDASDDIEQIRKVNPDDEITECDCEPESIEECDGETPYKQEGFFNRPKKLKPIPRDVVAYIAVELNNIRDANDQAMLSGYTCSKLEMVDFYLTCIDTNDARYIVPHTKDYLVKMQKELNDLLQRILKVKPINRYDRIWKRNVTLPEGM